MNILFLMSQLPYPLDTGAKIRTFNLIRCLSKGHRIVLAAFGGTRGESQKIAGIRDYCKNIELVNKTRNNLLVSVLANLFSRYPYSVDKYYSDEMVKKIKGLLKNENFDLIHCDSLQMSRNLSTIKYASKVLTEHNIESLILRRAARNENNIIKKIYLYLQYVKLKKYEAAACKQFDHIITVSEEERDFLSRYISAEKISVVPNGVDTEYFYGGAPRNDEGDSIVFTGSMDWPPNIDAVKYFCADILPLIWKVKKDIKFYIVGRNAAKDIIALGKNDSRIIVTGSVEDVRPYIETAIAFVAPLRIGGGTRLKILEALAMGKAVVSTSIGCEGLKVADTRDILIADKPDDFASSVIKLLDNAEARARLGRAGRNLVEEKYDWKIVSKRLSKAWDSAVNGKGLPILLYHDIRADDLDISCADIEKIPYIFNISEFEKQIGYLSGNNYKALSIKEFYDNKISAASGKAVVIVFDDGLISNYELALPILKKYGMKAVFFITVGNVGRDGFMGWNDIRELLNSGMEIGSHSLTHAIPTSLKEEELEHELRESKRLLENNLRIGVDYFSSPTGFYNPALPDIAKKVGYKAVLISKTSLNKTGEGFVLSKISIKRGCDLSKFISIVNGDEGALNKLRLKQETRNRLKKFLGSSLYNLTRKTVLEAVK